MSAPLRWVVNGAAGAALLGGLTLGIAWFADRSHRWEPPEWKQSAFIPLNLAPPLAFLFVLAMVALVAAFVCFLVEVRLAIAVLRIGDA